MVKEDMFPRGSSHRCMIGNLAAIMVDQSGSRAFWTSRNKPSTSNEVTYRDLDGHLKHRCQQQH